ncbi:hypothetical protein [Amphibiibacter pelophylacis]|uniref:Uncharacterized protein n=1 Tax=Amphibiibacter pelophylacis TaxID=1799477 RepID=A0ACC6P5R0_9BURK
MNFTSISMSVCELLSSAVNCICLTASNTHACWLLVFKELAETTFVVISTEAELSEQFHFLSTPFMLKGY